MSSPKWKIKNLSKGITFKKAAVIILNNRIKKAAVSIKKYLKDESPEKLHNVRISIRRLRYNLEIFYSLFDSKKLMKFHDLLIQIQNSTGNVRDIHITNENILLFKHDQDNGFNDFIINRLKDKQKIIMEDLRILLISYLNSSELKNFVKLIK